MREAHVALLMPVIISSCDRSDDMVLEDKVNYLNKSEWHITGPYGALRYDDDVRLRFAP